MSSAGAVHRLVVFGDACGSGKLGMAAKERMRAGMYGIFGEAFAAIGETRRHQEDRGDGILVALDPAVPPVLMVGRWIDTVHQALRELNSGSAERLRLRIGMNAGLVLDDGKGLVGRAVDLACRLCDSPTAKQIMAAAGTSDVLLVVSDALYTGVVAEGGRYVEPDCYRSARVENKETDERAWFYVPRLPEPPMGGARGAGGGSGTGGGLEPGAGSAPRECGPGSGGAAPAEGEGRPTEGEGGPTEGEGGPTEGEGGPAAAPRTVVNVRGDGFQVSDSVIHGGITGFHKDRGHPPAGGTEPVGEQDRRPSGQGGEA
ncbi:hypothetical protein ACFQVC_00935 [Streptomyces monticola]|uniref:Adenylate/guanylate cyclase domain-containing protein n=1 Tax=Streptomyces monticola TaxID=2666263 RepID=A0ABW2J9V5_9ACTN